MKVETRFYKLKMLFRVYCKNRKIKPSCDLGIALKMDWQKAEIMLINWLLLMNYQNRYVADVKKEYNI